ncbi:MAG TPA: acyl carrier protein [Thermoanaerobaculia bacterium]|jgi:acyl carrier protein
MIVVERIRDFLENELKIADARSLSPDLPLVQNGILDSIELLRVVAFLETEFSFTVADTEFVPSNLRSLSAMARFVEKKRAERPSA